MIDFKTTNLFQKLSTHESLKGCLIDIRQNCIDLGAKISELIPSFTDHSIKHMDALWVVADSVFTKDEIEKFTPAEVFVLGASFYFHDLGMSIASTKEGIAILRATEKYIAYYNRGINFYKYTHEQADIIALQLSARDLHSQKAMTLASEKIPGLDKYIIEKEAIRAVWANYIGEVSASHHWSITTLEQKLGARGVIPSPEGGNMDIGFIACALRIIDYAHINSERANYIERVLRSNIEEESIVHWKAQESIDGPSRHENKLKYASNKQIADVEAWWLFYDMVLGLDSEIVAVAEYLETKPWSQNRFSLEGVQNVKTPKSFSLLVRPLNFEPIDIRFKPDSIERLVDILGGKTLYGNDHFAPLRELIQNSRDAILLRSKQEEEVDDSDYKGKIIVAINNSSGIPELVIKDNGMGMSAHVIENYLLGIASDYWNSEDFYVEFPSAKKNGFVPTGKFGIGFLSVFMIGDKIEVVTERKGKFKYVLSLNGLGKHGSLISSGSTGAFGTEIRILVSKQDAVIYNNLETTVKARAPMLTFPVTVRTSAGTSVIEPEWWKATTQKDFFEFTSKWDANYSLTSDANVILRRSRGYRYNSEVDLAKVNRYDKWPDKQPELIEKNFRLLAIPDFGKVILCSRGIAVKSIALSGLTGIIEIDDLDLTASRDETIKWDEGKFVEGAIAKIRPIIVEALNRLRSEGSITSRISFIRKVASTYGKEMLLESTVPWLTVLVPPGDLKLFNPQELSQFLKDKSEILIGYGMGAWSTESICRNYFPSASANAVILPINDVGEPRFGSYSGTDDVMVNTLSVLFNEEDKDQDNVECDKYLNALFLISVIKIIAQSWSIDENSIVRSEWLKKGNSHLCAHLLRSNYV